MVQINPVKSIGSPQPTREGTGKWSKMQPGGIEITTVCSRGSGPETPAMNEDGTVNKEIRKTVAFHLEYSNCGDDSEVTEASPV